MSLVYDHTSEWRSRPVNLLKVVSSFVSQLSIGDELTRVSLPTEICHPFSILEVISFRELTCINVLYEINKYPDDPLQRFICVVRWLVSMMQQEQMEKKPFNPVIGEQHIAWIEHDENNWSEYISEQVSHHPPISAFFLRNKKENIILNSNLEFSVHFGGNHATIVSNGGVSLETGFESYKMNKISPNMVIQRVVWGTKYFMWDGEISMECPTTGYKVEMTLSEEDENTNRLVGKITKKGDNGEEVIIRHLKGITGQKTEMWKPDDEANVEELYNFDNFVHPVLHYPPPECQLLMDSLKLWKPVADPIIKDDMWEADLAKKKIEQDQRIREKAREHAGLEYKGVYFEHKEQEDGSMLWVFNQKETINPEFLQTLKEQVKVEEEELKVQEEEARRYAEENPSETTEGDGNCRIS
jgi:hypothetical protein